MMKNNFWEVLGEENVVKKNEWCELRKKSYETGWIVKIHMKLSEKKIMWIK